MLTKLNHWWQAIWSSFWFVPAVMVLNAVVLATVLITVDATVDLHALERWPLVSVINPDGLSEETAAELNAAYVISRQRTVETDAGFGIRQIVDIAIMSRMLCNLQIIACLTANPSRQWAIHERVEWIAEMAERTITSPYDRTRFEGRLARVREVFEAFSHGPKLPEG